MRKVIVSEFLSLDGVMQSPGYPDEDRSGGFEQTGGMLLGRVTYEIFAGFWPNAPADEPLAETINSMPKYVASRTLREPLEWETAHLLKGDVAEAVTELKGENGKDLQVIGSGELVQTLMQHDLDDEYRFMIHPVVIGSGKRLFRDGNPRRPLRLVDDKASSTGVLILTYEPADR